jgi:hypothetical protein
MSQIMAPEETPRVLGALRRYVIAASGRLLNYRSKIAAGAARIPTRADECAVLVPFEMVKSEAVTTNTCLLEVTSTSTAQHSASWP